MTAVRVSLNEGLTVLDLRLGNTTTVASLRQIIRNNGFVTKEAQVVAHGTAAASGGHIGFEVTGSRERFTLLPGGGQSAPYDDLVARLKTNTPLNLVITGTADIADPKAMRLKVTAVQIQMN